MFVLQKIRPSRLLPLLVILLCVSGSTSSADGYLKRDGWRRTSDDRVGLAGHPVHIGSETFFESALNESQAWTPRDFEVRLVENFDEFRMPAEFERQGALMVSCEAICCYEGICDAVRALAGRVAIIALHRNEDEYQSTLVHLSIAGIPTDPIRFARVPHNTMWTRDYGPVALISKSNRDVVVLDTQYPKSRPDDEVVPLFLAESARLPVIRVDLNIDGGNVITNGAGLVVTSTKVLDENPDIDVETVAHCLRASYGASQVVILEPLQHESTGHVDMFMTFTSTNRVIVGRYDPGDDLANAQILDRNARRLQNVRLPDGDLRVCRIPMPSNEDGIWRTYTNVVYANGILLLPTYSETRIDRQKQAIATYQSELPGWTVTAINADDLILSGGALHCVMMNLGPLSAERIGLMPREPRHQPFVFHH